mgnify:CR=1 FL=1
MVGIKVVFLVLSVLCFIFSTPLFTQSWMDAVVFAGGGGFLGELEVGARFPEPYSCLSYQGNARFALFLKSDGCEGKVDDWFVVPKRDAKPKYPNGYYEFQFNSELFIVEPAEFSKVRIYKE